MDPKARSIHLMPDSISQRILFTRTPFPDRMNIQYAPSWESFALNGVAPVTTLCCFPNRSIVCFLLET